ncbi:CAP domain-containing protein [Streptomyces sp. UNOB3_S3]|uniref:CAP domain-containing protein n=1 Tax=Streptomyces sp. UNOB3_S3 TaxID=2871682 RepID=UPI001E2A9D02|nr:CAP domain-containing protein [Streptomyces sp. UNOB3_S3]MCC3778690.1 RICIN domain-containing protein [Streptomyces sp. UNOB3_S3]
MAPQNGQAYVLRSATGVVVDVDHSSTAPGTRIQGWPANGSRAQSWVFWAKDNGSWLLETGLTQGTHGPGQAMVLDYDFSNWRAHLFNEHGQANQLWRLEDAGDGYVRLKSLRTEGGDAYLTADGAGRFLGVWKSDPGSDAQRWRLEGAPSSGQGGQAGQQPQPQPQPQPRPGTGGSDVELMLSLVNQERAKAGLPGLVLDRALCAAAQRQSDDMARNNFLGHNGSDGSDMGRRFKDVGIENVFSGENAATGSDVRGTMDMWMRSEGHRNNILGRNFRRFGAAFAPGSGGRWTQTFAS